MWLAAFFGMATKYSEGVLAIKYRTTDANGEIAGGPMHYIVNGMGKRWKPLAIAFSIFGVMVAYLVQVHLHRLTQLLTLSAILSVGHQKLLAWF